MNTRAFTILFLAVSIVGCKSKDDTTAANGPDAAPLPSPYQADKTGHDRRARRSADEAKPPAKKVDASGYSIIGKWTTNEGAMDTTVLRFQEGGKLTATNPLPNPKGASLEIDGNYKIEGNKLTMHTVTGKEIAPADANEAVKKKVATANKTMNQSVTSADEIDTLAWVDKDTFTVAGSSGTKTIYKRKT